MRREGDSCTWKNRPLGWLDSSNRLNYAAECMTLDRHNRRSGNSGEIRVVGYTPYTLPALGGVNRLGVFAPGDDGSDGLERTLDLFRAEGVALVIQLGEALLPRGTARSNDVDHIRRMLGRRQQAMLVCTDDLGRAVGLRRAGVRDTGARMVRPNLVHLDPGFSTRLSNDNIFVVVGPDPVASERVDVGSAGLGPAPSVRRGPAGRVGLAVSASHPDVPRVVRELAPKLLISAGNGDFLDERYSRDDLDAGSSSGRVIVFGDRAGQRIDHAIVHLTTGMVTLFPVPSGPAVARTQRFDGPES